jgi:outer membrane protein
MRHNYIYIFLLILNFSLQAQDVFPLAKAIDLAVSQNPQIQVAEMNTTLAGMQVYKANVGMTPRLDWNTNVNSSFSNVNLLFFDDRSINRFGRTFGPNTNLALSYNLYDGHRMKNQLKVLEKQADLTKINVQDLKDNIANEVTIAYYNIARQKQTIEYLDKIIKYYEERLKITEERWNVGRGSKLDFLQSQNDHNTQLSNLEQAKLLLDSYKSRLNLLLYRAADTPFDTEPIQLGAQLYDGEKLLKEAIVRNEELQMLDNNIEINNLLIKQLEGEKKPRVNLNSTFGYNFNSTNAGQIVLNQSAGLNAGLAATWNLYDGKHNSKQREIVRYRTAIVEKQKENILAQIKSDIHIANQTYTSSVKTLALEEKNKTLAEENLNIALEKFKLGASNILELNDAQQRYDTALNRNVEAFYRVKFAEAELARIER